MLCKEYMYNKKPGIMLIIYVPEESFFIHCIHVHACNGKGFFFANTGDACKIGQLFLLFFTKMCVFKSKTVGKRNCEVKVLTNIFEKLPCHSMTVQTVLNFVIWPKIDHP